MRMWDENQDCFRGGNDKEKIKIIEALIRSQRVGFVCLHET